MHETLAFIRSFLHDSDVASITPTRQRYAETICQRCNPHARVIVEYGPGTGSISRCILRYLPPDGVLILIEKNPELAEILREELDDMRIRMYCDSAGNIESILRNLGIEKVDHVISGIPGKEATDALLEATQRILGDGGSFIVYQFLPFMRGRLAKIFGSVGWQLLPWNIPPLVLFEAKGN